MWIIEYHLKKIGWLVEGFSVLRCSSEELWFFFFWDFLRWGFGLNRGGWDEISLESEITEEELQKISNT